MATFPAGAVNPISTTLASSSNASSGGYNDWTTRYQTIQGMWRRVWVYKAEPTLSSGVFSGTPEVDYTYVDVFVDVKTKTSIESENHVSGSQTLHVIQYDSDSATDGFGVEGVFWTTTPGQIVSTSATGDTAGTCQQTFNVRVGEIPGDYDATYDTSSQLPGQFFNDVVMGANELCPDFNINLVNM